MSGDDVLVVAEHRRGELREVSYGLVSAGRELADATDGQLRVAIIGGRLEAFADKLAREGVDVIHTVDAGEDFNHDVYVQVLEQLDGALEPGVVLLGNTVNGLDFAPAIATRLGRPLVTDAIGIEVGEEGIDVTREMYGSKVETVVRLDRQPVVLTIRDAEWPPVEANGEPAIEPFDATIDEDAIGSSISGYEEVAGGDVDITEADVLVSVGRGIGDEENIELVERLAEALDATLSASRPIVDNGWLPKNRQVGQSGKTVTPDVYIAIGISGAVQHVAGMKGADTIIAINTDPSAPIFDIADYGIVDDLFDVVPALIEAYS